MMPKTKKKAKSAAHPSDYFPDIDEWPNQWMGTKEDLEIGRGLLALFTPFIQHLIDEFRSASLSLRGRPETIIASDRKKLPDILRWPDPHGTEKIVRKSLRP